MPAAMTNVTSHSSQSSFHSYPFSDKPSDPFESTADTLYSPRPSYQRSPDIKTNPDPKRWAQLDEWEREYKDFKSSATTYASTVSSGEDGEEELSPYEIPEDEPEFRIPSAVAASPREFADYFPSTRRVNIRHDDMTLDGNMNLRLDTAARTSDGQTVDLTLFHLRMHDLKQREFSLRRYCRESGREVCHSSRKVELPPALRRPGLQRSVSSVLTALRSKSESMTATRNTVKKLGSGYDSTSEDDFEGYAISPAMKHTDRPPPSSDIVSLEFSNYAHLNIRRRGGSSIRYEFEYWGTKYAWKRVAQKSGEFREISYHLVDTSTSSSVAHIVPVPLSRSEAREEDAKGGWIPPCSMWISDEKVLDSSLDVAEAIVASGLIALVDDTIRERWHTKRRLQLSLPMLSRSSAKAEAEQISPKRVLDEILNRKEWHHPPPVRQMTS